MSGNIYASDGKRIQDGEVGSDGPAPRMSLWSVPAQWGGAFFILLVSQGGFLVGLQAWRRVVTETDAHTVDTVLSIALVSAPLLVVAGIVSMIELEVALTLSAWYEWRIRKKQREEFEAGLEEGRRLERAKIERERAKIERERVVGSRVRRHPY